jgi:tellurite resistance protein
MEYKPLNPDARALEEAFFAEENRRLLQRLREKRDREARRAAMREALPNADDALIDHLLELGIGPETALAVVFVPLAMVAWADGDVEPREREAILRAAEERGMSRGTPAREVLESWLGRKPGAELIAAWKRYVRTVGSGLGHEERQDIRNRMLQMARDVASAEGGFLGLTKKISPAERAVIEEIEQTFR